MYFTNNRHTNLRIWISFEKVLVQLVVDLESGECFFLQHIVWKDLIAFGWHDPEICLIFIAKETFLLAYIRVAELNQNPIDAAIFFLPLWKD